MTVYTLSDAGISLLIKRESIRRMMYLDSAGLPTIGIGHLLTKDELSSGKITIGGERVRWHDEGGLSDAQVKQLFAQDLKVYEQAVNKDTHIELAQYQYDCLVSFCFNVGTEAFRGSTLLKKVNTSDFASVPAELGKWVHSAGKVNKGLVNRRAGEILQWQGKVLT